LAITTSDIVIQHKIGLHARPAAIFAKTASKFASSIQVENLTKNTGAVNAKSVLRLLSAGIEMQDHIRITAEGDDAEAAVSALCHLININFGEAE
jgi:phosphotransferase system HPr (HPr) family protein